MKKSNLLLVILVVILVGGGAFFAGMKYQQSKSPLGRLGNFPGGRGGQFQQQRFGQGFRPVNGEIISQDEKSLSVKLQDGSSKIVIITDSTAINKASAGVVEDLKVGEKVAVFGTENSDGSVTAQNIQLNPQFQGINGGTPE